MITVTYPQLAVLFMVPLIAAWLFEVMRRCIFYRDLLPGEQSEVAARQRGLIVDAIVNSGAPNLANAFADGPTFKDHVQALRRGEDPVALYDQSLHEIAQIACYGTDIASLYRWLRLNEPKVFQRFLKSRKVLTRLVK